MKNNKNLRMISLKGFGGFVLIALAAMGLFGGFVYLPMKLMTIGWNTFVVDTFGVPKIYFWQSIFLWIILYISLSLALRDHIGIGFHSATTVDTQNIDEFIKDIKEQEKEKELSQDHKE